METDKIIKALRHCSVSGNSYRECPAYNQDSGCLDRLHAQAADLLEEQQKRIAELEEQQRWISGKRPPKEWRDENGDARNFLAVIPDVGVDIANWIEPVGCWFCMGIPCKVTHWMPLPEPPKGVERWK